METTERKVKVLLVDDEPANLVAMEAILQGLGTAVVKAGAGREALRHLLLDEFAVVVLDVKMPGMDGFETAALVRGREQTRDTPIIFLTAAYAGDEFVARGYSLGAVDYLLKPVQPEILRAKVAVFVELFRKREEIRRQAEELRRKNAELELQSRHVEALYRRKGEFLAGLSHELRTPLNSIIGFSQLLCEGKLGPMSEEIREYVGDILVSSRHLAQLVNNMLDLAKLESGKMGFWPQPLDLARVVGEVEGIVRALAIQKLIHVETEVDPTLAEVVSDPVRLKQVLYNYLSNAIKFTPEGGRVWVRVRPEGPKHFRLDVEDTGIGIRPEDQGRLFREFEQIDPAAASEYPGTGLGLSLTKQIVEAQGGAVGVRSVPGQGSVFHAVLPRVGGEGGHSGPEPPQE
ncbi:MAG: hybrid sensor histidine kinase/response regulator [Chloroflexi bacterium]|nr:hybrid sensor histidine kinase/response regulator [Chloroflexota bacterium]